MSYKRWLVALTLVAGFAAGEVTSATIAAAAPPSCSGGGTCKREPQSQTSDYKQAINECWTRKTAQDTVWYSPDRKLVLRCGDYSWGMIHIQDNHNALRNVDAFAKCIRNIAVSGRDEPGKKPHKTNRVMKGRNGLTGTIVYDNTTSNIISVFPNGQSPDSATDDAATGDRWEDCASA